MRNNVIKVPNVYKLCGNCDIKDIQRLYTAWMSAGYYDTLLASKS